MKKKGIRILREPLNKSTVEKQQYFSQNTAVLIVIIDLLFQLCFYSAVPLLSPACSTS